MSLEGIARKIHALHKEVLDLDCDPNLRQSALDGFRAALVAIQEIILRKGMNR